MADSVERLAVEIRVQTTARSEPFRGSGFAVGPGLVMTARHVLEDATDIWIRWAGVARDDVPSDVASAEFDDERFLAAERVDCVEEDLDIAVLRTAAIPRLDWFQLSDAAPATGTKTSGIGWPNATAGNTPRSESLNGTVKRAASQETGGNLEIKFDRAAHDEDGWRGASGAPVVDLATNKVIGVFVLTEDRLRDADIAWAIPSTRILRAEPFRKLLLEASCSEEDRRKAWSAHREKFSVAIRRALRRLHADAKTELVEEFGLDTAAAESEERLLADVLQDPEAAMLALRRLQRDAPDKKAGQKIGSLIGLIAAYAMPEEDAGLIVWLARDGELPNQAAVGGSVEMELWASREKSTEPLFLPRKTEFAKPVGKKALAPDPGGAETGPDAERRVNDVERSIYQRTGLGLFRSTDHFERHLAVTRPGLRGQDTSRRTGALTEQERQNLKDFFRRVRVDIETPYYTPRHVGLNVADAAEADRLTDHIRTHYPDVLIIPCDAETTRDDRIYDLLVQSVPVEGDTQT